MSSTWFAWNSSQHRRPPQGRWQSSWRRQYAIAGLALGWSVNFGQAQAQSAENVAAARAMGAQGVQLAQEGKCAEAIDLLARAEQLYHAPTILVALGQCQCEQGLLVEGTEALNRVVRENLGANPPPAFVDAQGRAQSLLAEYSPKLAKLIISVKAPANAAFEVLVDDKPVPAALLGVPRPTDPGEHQVTAQGDGLQPASSAVTLSEGGQAQVELVLEAVSVNPQEQLLVPREGAGPEDPGPPVVEQEPNRVPAYISFGIGAVGIAAGSYFGLSALSKQSALDDRCNSGQCPPGSQSDIDSMSLNANLATAGFAVGVVGVGLGIYFLLSADDAPSGTASRVCEQAPCVEPLLGLNYLGMEGVF